MTERLNPLPTPLTVGRDPEKSPITRSAPVKLDAEVAEIITELYESGLSLTEISNRDGMPCYGTILKHLKFSEAFRKQIEGARAVRAMHHEEQALLAAESAVEKDDVPAARLKFDAYVWAAGVNDPNTYGKKTTIQGDPTRPITFHISTGVPEPLNSKQITLNPDGTVKEVDITDQSLDTKAAVASIDAEIVDVPSA